MLTPMEATQSTNTARLRRAVGWFGVAFFAALAVVASAYLLFDAWRVATHISSLASVRIALEAAVVILGGLMLVAVFAWLAGRSVRATAIATVVALVTLILIRIAIALAYDGVLSGEPGIYTRLAETMASGNCCLWDAPIDRPPGYVFILAAAFAVGGQTPAVAEGLNIVMALATGLLVLALARHLYGPRVGAVALLLYALWPAGALMITAPLPHTSYELAIAAGAWAVVAGPKGWKGSALAGGILGLSQYLRPTTMLLLPLFLVARLWGSGRWQGFITGTLIPMCLAFLLVLLPIVAWNVSTRGAIDLSTSANGGKTFYHGTNVTSGGSWSRQAADELAAAGGDDDWARSAAGMRMAIDRALKDPLAITALAIRKQTTLWGREAYGVRYGIRRELASRPYLPKSVLPSLASGTFYVGLLALTALGLWIRRRRTDGLSVLLIGMAVMLSLLHGLVEVRDRYHSYLIPLLMPIAAVAIIALVDRLRRLRQAQLAQRDGVADGTDEGVTPTAVDEAHHLPLTAPVADETRGVQVRQRDALCARDAPGPKQSLASGEERARALGRKTRAASRTEAICRY